MSIVREHITIEDLRKKGVSLVSGDRYIPASLFPKKVISLAKARRLLSKIKGSLAQTVFQIRDEE